MLQISLLSDCRVERGRQGRDETILSFVSETALRPLYQCQFQWLATTLLSAGTKIGVITPAYYEPEALAIALPIRDASQGIDARRRDQRRGRPSSGPALCDR